MLKALNRRLHALAFQFTMAMTALVVAAVAGVSTLSIQREQETYNVELERQARSTVESVSIFAADWLYYIDVAKLWDTQAMLREANLVDFARFYDPDGRVLTDSSVRRGARTFEIDPLGKRLVGADGIVLDWQADRLVAGKAVTAGRQRLGAISLEFSTAPLEAKLGAVRNQGIAVGIAALVLGTLLALVISRSITGPVQALVRATERAAAGDLAQQISARGSNELATLAAAFNRMGAQLQRTLASLRESEERYALAIRGANDGLWDWDLTTNQIYFSPRWKAMLGCREDEIGGNPDAWFDRIHPQDHQRVKLQLSAHLAGPNPQFESEYRVLHQDGTHRWVLVRGVALRDEAGRAYRMAGSQTDITQRKRTEEQLLHDALHDALTGLPNRSLFLDVLERAIERRKRRPEFKFAVLFLDFDDFKVVNDTLGHTAGDQLLAAIAPRLEGCVRSGHTVARLGGDEFVVLLEDMEDVGLTLGTADRIQTELKRPFTLNGRDLVTSVSIGIVLSDTGHESADEILRDADIAMYRAKTLGRGRHVVFESAMRANVLARLELESDLRMAVPRQELRLHYQPIVWLSTGRVVGFEALVRWQHPRLGLLSPAAFVPLAEETGLIATIDEWVLHEACRQLVAWKPRVATDRPLTVSVNLSSAEFARPSLPSKIEAVLRETGLGASRLRLEITEGTIMTDAESNAAVLAQLKAMGVHLEIDDFGTGYSSLSYLQRIPIDAIKIDRSFVSQMCEDSSSTEIIRTIVTLAHGLGIQVVAEGVETPEQLARLATLGCEAAQGYLFSPPLDPASAAAFLSDRRPDSAHPVSVAG